MEPHDFLEEITTGPQLEHNRRESRRLIRRKRQFAVASIVAVLPVALLVPDDYVVAGVMGLFVLTMIAIGYFEIRRVLVFRRDVRQRKSGGNTKG